MTPLEISLKDPLGVLDPLPDAILDLYLERGSPPRLSPATKLYYYLRPYIPLTLRHFLQSSRPIKVPPKWYVTELMLQMYAGFLGGSRFERLRKTLWPEGKASPIVMTHDVESLAGFKFIPKVLELEGQYGIKSSWNIVPYLYPIDIGIVRLIEDSGSEIGIHGYNHDGKLFLSKRIFNERAPYINQAIKRFRAAGFRAPAAHRNMEWLQELDIDYDASCFDIDPFQPMPGGTHSIWPFRVGRFVELPYTLPQDHVLWIQLKESTNDIWEEKTRWLRDNSGMILLITHPDYLMIGKNMNRYKGLLEFMLSFGDLWNVLPSGLVKYWREKNEGAIS